MLKDITLETVVNGIVEWMNEVVDELVIEGIISAEKITADTKPHIFTTSVVLVTKFSELEEKLKIEIPHNCYPFYNHRTHQQLSIQEAADVLIKRANHAR